MTDFEHILIVSRRYVALCKRYSKNATTNHLMVAAALDTWHRFVEPLRLDLLAKAEDVDLAHDVSGVLRGDKLQSARYALAYHPRTH